MRKKILIAVSGTVVALFLCFFTLFVISVNQAKNIVKLINEQNYDSLEKACDSAIFIDKVPVYSQIGNAFIEVNVWTPLQEACFNDDIKAVKILLERGANPNKTPPFQLPWYVPLQIAASNGNVEMMALLIEYGADVEAHGQNALILLTKDARWNVKTEECISFEIYKEGYTLLEKHGMDASHSSFEDRSLLCESALLSDLEVTDYLISEKGMDATVCDSDGRTLLHFACLSGYKEPTVAYTQYLLDCGIDPSAQDSYGKTAYDYAVEKGRTEIADLLIESH